MSVPRPVAAVLAAFADLAPVAPDSLPLAEAAGLALAEPLRVAEALPNRATALRPGWAVSSRDLVGASPYAPVTLVSPSLLGVGDPLPSGTDALLPPEALSAEGEVTAEVVPGDGLRRAGADAAAGAVLAEAGARVGPTLVGVAAALGMVALPVRRPRVRLVAPAGAAGRLLAAACRAAGAHVETEGGVDLVVEVLRTEAERAALAARLGAGLVAGRVALRPGGEMLVAGLAEGHPVIAVADRPEAALAAYLLLIAPLLARLSGSPHAPRAASPRPLARKLASRVGLTELALLRAVDAAWEPVAVGEATLSALGRAEAWLPLPPESEGLPAGAPVAPYLL